jgi:hypothetical protein
MGHTLRVNDARAAKEIAIEAAKSMWRYTLPSFFYEVKYDEKAKSWNVEANYFEEKLTFKIDATTGNVSGFKIEKNPQKK